MDTNRQVLKEIVDGLQDIVYITESLHGRVTQTIMTMMNGVAVYP